jgi:hybrid cluster-associated redox disulfide protein
MISKSTRISEIVEKHPDVVEILINDYGFHCFGCFASHFETFEQGALVHGYTPKEIITMLKKLNLLIKSSSAKG